MSDPTTELDAPYQPPMANGEVLFDAPWQGRVFGMAVALHEQGVFTWQQFQQTLIEVIGEWDRGPQQGEYQYYEHFQQALQRLLARLDVLDPGALITRTAEYAAREHGHDHHH